MGEQEAGGGGGADMDLEDMEESDEEGGEEEEEPEEEDESETMNQVSFSENGERVRLSRFFLLLVRKSLVKFYGNKLSAVVFISFIWVC